MKSRNCEQIQAQLLDYIEREMSSDDRERVSEHLAQCHNCNMEYEGLRAMLNTTRNLPIDDPGEEFWRQLPQKVLEEVRQHKKNAAVSDIINADKINNVVNLHTQRQPANHDVYHQVGSGFQPSSNGKAARTNYHTDFKAHRLTAAAAIAAILLLVINVTMINVTVLSPNSNRLWFDQANYQARIDTNSALPQLVKMLPLTSPADSAPLGFVEQNRADKAYAVGTMLAASFVYVHNRQFPAALQQLHILQNRLQQPSHNPQVSAVTLSSIRKAVELLQAPDIIEVNENAEQQLAALLTQFQVDYGNFISRSQAQQLILYRAGIWVFNVGLAVAAQDSTALMGQDVVPQLNYLQKAFSRLKAPVGVRNSLQDIATVLVQQSSDNAPLNRKNFESLQQALQNLNALLS